MDENKLIAQCIKRDQKAMTELFRRYAHVLKTSCRRILKDSALADDVFQEGFIKIFEQLDSFAFKSSLYTWMNRVIVNTALSHLRRKNIIYSSLDILELDIEDEQKEEDESLFGYLEELDGEQIIALLFLLPDKYRIVLNLFAIDGMKHSEIAERLGISEDLSKKMVSRARIKLMGLVQQKQNEHEAIRYPSAK